MTGGRSGWTWLGALALVAVAAGCAPSLGSVSGSVTYEGEPIGEGYVTFEPVDGQGNSSGGPIKAGRYTCADVVPGKMRVNIIGVKEVNFASSSEEMMQRAEEMKNRGDDSGLVDPADTVPTNAKGNGQEIEIKAGAQTIDFALTKPSL